MKNFMKVWQAVCICLICLMVFGSMWLGVSVSLVIMVGFVTKKIEERYYLSKMYAKYAYPSCLSSWCSLSCFLSSWCSVVCFSWCSAWCSLVWHLSPWPPVWWVSSWLKNSILVKYFIFKTIKSYCSSWWEDIFG